MATLSSAPQKTVRIENAGRFQGYADTRLAEAEREGREPSVLRDMQEHALKQFLFRCESGKIDVEKLSTSDRKRMFKMIFSGISNDPSPGPSVLNHSDFDEFYESVRSTLAKQGARAAESKVRLALSTMRSVCSAMDQGVRQPWFEQVFVNAGRDAASACRVNGRGVDEVAGALKSDPVLSRSPFMDKTVDAIHADTQRARRYAGLPAQVPPSTSVPSAGETEAKRGLFSRLIRRG